MNMKNWIALFLTLVVSLGVLASCGSKKKNVSSSEDEEPEKRTEQKEPFVRESDEQNPFLQKTEEKTGEEKPPVVTKDLSGEYTSEIKDLRGHEFFFMKVQDKQDQIITVYAGDLIGDKKNDAAFARNANLQYTYNCTIGEEKSTVANAREALIAGEYVWDILYAPVTELKDLASAGLLVDLSTLEELDLGKTWWDREAAEANAENGHTYFAFPAGSVGGYAFAIPKTAEIMQGYQEAGFSSGEEMVGYFLQAFVYQESKSAN